MMSIKDPASFAPLFAMETKQKSQNAPDLSIVIPMYNEGGGAVALVEEIHASTSGFTTEIIVVDDCSQDDTQAELASLAGVMGALRILVHAENAGQSRAIRTGILAARAPVIVTLDGDGQNDPKDIIALFEQLQRRDAPSLLVMVAGERRRREDSWAKRWSSRIANVVRGRVLNDGAVDTGCGLKVFYKSAFLRLPYFDHLHRYLPALMRREGFIVEYQEVNHRPRQHGQSKYTNFGRLLVAVRDLLGVLWLNSRARSPKQISEVQTSAACDKVKSDR